MLYKNVTSGLTFNFFEFVHFFSLFLLIANIPRKLFFRDLPFFFLSNFTSRIHFCFLRPDPTAGTASVLDSPRAAFYTQFCSERKERNHLQTQDPTGMNLGEKSTFQAGISFWVPSSVSFSEISVSKYVCKRRTC